MLLELVFIIFLLCIYAFFFFFFFSSRRRHTRWNCDWSSDVCSSDLRWLRFSDGRSDSRVNCARIWRCLCHHCFFRHGVSPLRLWVHWLALPRVRHRSEEHTSELQSQFHLVCRLLLEKKKKKHNNTHN